MSKKRFSRRRFLGHLTATVGGCSALGALTTLAPASVRSAELSNTVNSSLKGHILGVLSENVDLAALGLEPSQASSNSALVDLDLATGEMSYALLPDYRYGHSVIQIDNDNFYCVPYSSKGPAPCLFLNRKLEVTGSIDAPDGYGFGGHAALMPGGKTIFGHFNRVSRTAADTGQIYLVDVDKKKIVKTEASSVLHGHDIIPSVDGKHIIVSDDGTVHTPVPEGSPFTEIIHDPALYFYDVDSLSLVNKVPHGLNGSFVHIDQAPDLAVYGAIEQYVRDEAGGEEEVAKLLGDEMKAYLAANSVEGETPLPSPVVSVDPENKKVTKFQGDLSKHTNAFDIKYHNESGYLLNVFIRNSMILRCDPSTGKTDYFSSLDFGIETPSGLASIEGTSYVALNGIVEGVAIIDVSSMRLVKRFDVKNYSLKHLLYVA